MEKNMWYMPYLLDIIDTFCILWLFSGWTMGIQAAEQCA